MPLSSSTNTATLQQFRAQFPALETKYYFNYGGQGPMSQAALTHMSQMHQYIQAIGPFSRRVNQWIQNQAAETRQMLAAELGATADAIALTEDVTVGCNIPLWGLDWRAGDHILLTDCEHPGVIAAVQEISRRFQVEVSTCPILATCRGGDPVTVIAEHLRSNTRLLVISHILWNTGQVMPLAEIVARCHIHQPHPVLVLVDAAQSVGMMPLDLPATGVDFYAFTGHKWYCGPAGLGGLYIKPEVMSQLRPTFIGWRGITTDEAANPTGWKPNSQRFEIATSDFALYGGLRSAIAIHNQWGTPQHRYNRICELSQLLWQKLRDMGAVPQNNALTIAPLSPTPPASGLVSFRVMLKGQPSPKHHVQLVQTLEAKGYLLRTLLHPHCVRACLHYFTLESDIEQLVANIADYCSRHDPSVL
ncbi:MAG: aminotransferase class V-fold PLP-dependent enzyme [Cyanobacteria bacterium J06635_15]